MELIKFDAKRCSLCGKCVEKCPFGALSFEDNGIVVGDTCRMCGMCVRQCPEKAISFEQKAGSFDKDKWKDFLIFVEQERGDIHPVVFELIGKARKMASKVNFKVKCVIAGGAGTIENAHKLLDYGVDQVFAYEDESLEGFRADCYTDVVAECIAAQKPSSVLIGATALGRSLAPRLATRFHTGLTADCTTLDIKSNTDMVQIRPAFGGNIMATIVCEDFRPQMATVRPGVMKALEADESRQGEVEVVEVNFTDADMNVKIREVVKTTHKSVDITEAKILVAGGRGVGNAEGFKDLEALADTLDGEVAASRAAVDSGWISNDRQVGQTGKTVRPELYLACGISGAIQHAAGMENSEFIVAINRDEDAAIFDIADLGVVGDIKKILPKLNDAIKAVKEK